MLAINVQGVTVNSTPVCRDTSFVCYC